jgi:hypothetical protein
MPRSIPPPGDQPVALIFRNLELLDRLRYRALLVRRVIDDADDWADSATIDAERWPDETAVRDHLCPKAVCTKCGMIGADVRPDWSERSLRESLTGAQWR